MGRHVADRVERSLRVPRPLDNLGVLRDSVHEPAERLQFALVPLDLGDQVDDGLLLLLQLVLEFS
ncbi:MAG TPA: hypothetical protein PKY15_06295, partial [Methanoregulaceae archaeon]|nr:hypothetical protein [Methanoregulaceae archaeon]